jgi:hypothetical protein
VAVSDLGYQPGRDRSAHLILTLGIEPWCSSVWHPVYFRAWQTKDALPEPVLLLDGKEMADVGYPVHGAASHSDVLFEYTVIGPEAERVPEVRHYVMEQDRLVRKDPIAITPRDFVAAWLRYPWTESSQWTAKEERSKLEAWRRGNNGNVTVMEAPTWHCRQHPDLWQVTAFDESTVGHQLHFLVRWQPPYHFEMVSVGGLPNPGCDESDPAADNPLPLFPNQ